MQSLRGSYKVFLDCSGGGAEGVEERWRAGPSARHGRQVAQTHSVAKSDIFIGCKQCEWCVRGGARHFLDKGRKGGV